MKKVRGNRSGKPMKRKPKQREEKKKLNIKKRWDHLSSVNAKHWTSLLQNMLHFMAKKTGRFLHMKEMSLLSITIFFRSLVIRKEDFKIPDIYDIVPKEEIAEFEDIMRKIITGIISEASGIATWVYVQKYEKHKTLDEMLQEWQGAGQFIIVMDTWFERLMAE